MASNNSRNGSWDLVFDAANAMFEDTHQRLSLDSTRIYTSGFSGGARAAVAVAENYDRVACVIACGAGLPNPLNYRPKVKSSYAYVGIIGNGDMNYMELQQVRVKLSGLQITNSLIHFDGGHQWPPQTATLEAIEWLELMARRGGLKPLDTGLVRYVAQKKQAKVEQLTSQSSFMAAADLLEQLIKDLSGMVEIKDYQRSLEEICQSKIYKQQKAATEKAWLKENDQIQAFLAAFRKLSFGPGEETISLQDLDWWDLQRRNINRWMKGGDLLEQQMGTRLLDFVGRSCVERSQTYYDAEYEMAIRFDQVWSLVQPKNKYPYFRLSRSYALLGQAKSALKYLKLSIEHGLSDQRVIVNEKAFDSLRNEKEYQKLLLKL